MTQTDIFNFHENILKEEYMFWKTKKIGEKLVDWALTPTVKYNCKRLTLVVGTLNRKVYKCFEFSKNSRGWFLD